MTNKEEQQYLILNTPTEGYIHFNHYKKLEDKLIETESKYNTLVESWCRLKEQRDKSHDILKSIIKKLRPLANRNTTHEYTTGYSDCATDMLKYLDENYAKLTSKDFNNIRELWFSYSNIIGKKIQVNDEKEVITGIVIEVDESGCLILNTDKGKERIVSGDITFL